MNIESGERLEQAKKRDHKIMITDAAISKVPCLKIPECGDAFCKKLQSIHKALLKEAQTSNDSNEVAVVYNIYTIKQVFVRGDEGQVDVDSDIDIKVMYNKSHAEELVLIHNHPSTSNFSLADIDYFIANEYLFLMSVVTNQGEVYAIYKTSAYNYNEIRKLEKQLANKYSLDRQAEIAKEFLKQCQKGGVRYVKGKN